MEHGTEVIFIALNIVYAGYGTYKTMGSTTNSGRPGFTTQGGWIPVWQGLGVVLVLMLHASPWYLIWWWFLGVIAGAGVILSLLTGLGILPPNLL